MSIQTETLRLSVHTQSAIDPDMYHIRLVVKDEQIRPFLDVLERLWVLGEHDYMIDGRYKLGQHRIDVIEGDYTEGTGVTWAYGQCGEFYWNLERRGDDLFLDLNAYHEFELDYTKAPSELPLAFWVEPAAVIRAFMGKGGH
jgi:hypothetical protein